MILAVFSLTGKAAILAAAVATSATLPALADDSAFARGTSAAGRLDRAHARRWRGGYWRADVRR